MAVPTQSPAAASVSAARTRCVLWRLPSEPAPEALLRSLDERGVEVIDCVDAYMAVAEVMRIERANDARADASATGPPRDPVILLVSPDNVAGAGAVCQAMERFAPHAVCWRYEVGANLVLTPLVEEGSRARPGVRAAAIAG